MTDTIAAGAAAPAPSPAPSTPTESAAPTAAVNTSAIADNKAAEAQRVHDDAMDAIWDKHQRDDDEYKPRERGTDGRFASKLPDKIDLNSPADQSAKPSDKPLKTEDPPKSDVAPAEPAAEAPKWWSDDLKAKFKGLPGDVAKAIGEQALSDRQTISKLGNALQSFQPINDVISRHRQEFDAAGVSAVEGIGQLLQAQQKLANPATRAEAYQYLLKHYPADVSHLGVDPYGLPPDPQITAQNDRIAALERHNAMLEADYRRRVESEQYQKYQHSLSTVDSVAAKLPHFNEVAEDVLFLLPGIRARNPSLSDEQAITQAYERAKWAHPATREKLQKDEIEKQQKAALATADAARRANALNVRGRQPTSTPQTERDLDERIWNKHYAH